MILRVVPKCLPRQSGPAVPGSSPVAVPLSAQAPVLGSRAFERGGSLVEVIVAIVILSILGAGIVGSINYGMFMMRLARENARATQVLLEKTEALRLYTWDQIVYSNNFLPSTFTAAYDPQAASTNNQGCIYFGYITNSSVPFSTSYSTNLRQISIALQWTSFGGINHSRSITTYIAKDGLQNYVY